jgi:hypothetical protein
VQKAAPAERKALMAHLADLSVADRLEHIVTDMSHIPRTIRIRMRSWAAIGPNIASNLRERLRERQMNIHHGVCRALYRLIQETEFRG